MSRKGNNGFGLDNFTWTAFLICIALIFSGIFTGIETVKLLNQRGYIFGDGLSLDFRYTIDHLDYATSSVVLSPTGEANTYEYKINTLRMDDFDGVKNSYRLFVNENLGYETKVYLRQITSNFSVNFYEPDSTGIDDIAFSSSIEVQVQFLSSSTSIKITYVGSADGISWWNEYFEDYNFRLRAETIKGV